ncbi:hypothetical protein ABIE67_001338 [Streptomyces sp. V4I8]
MHTDRFRGGTRPLPVPWDDDGVHEHPVVLQGHIVGLRRQPYEKGAAGLLVAYLQHLRQGESALVEQGSAGFGVQVVEVIEEQGGQGAAAERRGRVRQEFVEVAGARYRAVSGVQAEGAAQRTGLVAQPVAVAAVRQRRARAQYGFGESGGVPLPLAAVGKVVDTEAAADVHGPGPEPTAPALLQHPQTALQCRGLLGEARRVQVVCHADQVDHVAAPLDGLQERVQLPYGGAESAGAAQHPHAGRLEPRQPEQDAGPGQRVFAYQRGELLQFASRVEADGDRRAGRQPQEFRVLRSRRRDPVRGEARAEGVLQLPQRGDVHAGVRGGEPPQQGAGPVGLVGEEHLAGEVVSAVHRAELLEVVGELVGNDHVQWGPQGVGERVQQVRRVQQRAQPRFQPRFEIQGLPAHARPLPSASGPTLRALTTTPRGLPYSSFPSPPVLYAL